MIGFVGYFRGHVRRVDDDVGSGFFSLPPNSSGAARTSFIGVPDMRSISPVGGFHQGQVYLARQRNQEMREKDSRH